MTCKGPRSPSRGDEQKATFIQESQVGTQAAGFFYGRPLVALPMGDRLLVALDGTALQHLTAPTQATSDLPDRRGVMTRTPKVALYHGGDALQGPQLVGKAMRPGPLQQERDAIIPERRLVMS